MKNFIETYMHDPVFDRFYPWATPVGIAVTLALALVLSALLSWFLIYVVKPRPGCIYEGPLPFGFYMGDPRNRAVRPLDWKRGADGIERATYFDGRAVVACPACGEILAGSNFIQCCACGKRAETA